MADYLKKYTELRYLENTLKTNSLFLADPSDWADKNDKFAIDLSGTRKPGVLCMTSARDRFHFWTVFGKEESGVCLWFKKNEFVKSLRERKDLTHGDVSYPSKRSLLERKTTKLGPAFCKREQYKDEKEYRIVKQSITSETERQLPFPKQSLHKVYLNAWLQPCCVKEYKKQIAIWLQNCGYSGVEVKQNRVKNFKRWQNQLSSAFDAPKPQTSNSSTNRAFS